MPKVYSSPIEAPVFVWNNDGMGQYDSDFATFKIKLADYFKELGYTGKYTGEVASFQIADGSAQYMLVEAPRGSQLKEKFFLIHLDYLDGYRSPHVQHMTKKGIIETVEYSKRLAALCRKPVSGE